MTSESCLIPRRAGLALLLIGSACAGSAVARPATPREAAIQRLADVTLIDLQCRGVTVMFGTAFRMAASEGLNVADVMPGGPLRARFDADMRRRTVETPQEELCGALAKDYATAVPGLVLQP